MVNGSDGWVVGLITVVNLRILVVRTTNPQTFCQDNYFLIIIILSFYSYITLLLYIMVFL